MRYQTASAWWAEGEVVSSGQTQVPELGQEAEEKAQGRWQGSRIFW